MLTSNVFEEVYATSMWKAEYVQFEGGMELIREFSLG